MTASKPTPIAVAVVEFQGQVLIGQRPPEAALAGYWEFPGGKILPGETAEAAAVRECREETGLEIRIIRPLAAVEHQYEHTAVRISFFLAKSAAATCPPDPPFRWVPIAELENYHFPPANRSVIEELSIRHGGLQDF